MLILVQLQFFSFSCTQLLAILLATSRDQLRHFFSICSVVLQSLTEEQLKNGLT